MNDLRSWVPIHCFVVGERHLVSGLGVLPQSRQGDHLITDTAKGLAGLARVGAEDSIGVVSLSSTQQIVCLSLPCFLTSL